MFEWLKRRRAERLKRELLAPVTPEDRRERERMEEAYRRQHTRPRGAPRPTSSSDEWANSPVNPISPITPFYSSPAAAPSHCGPGTTTHDGGGWSGGSDSSSCSGGGDSGGGGGD